MDHTVLLALGLTMIAGLSTGIGSLIALAASLAVMVPAVGALGMNGVTAANVLSCLASAAFMLVSLLWLVRAQFKGGEKPGRSGPERSRPGTPPPPHRSCRKRSLPAAAAAEKTSFAGFRRLVLSGNIRYICMIYQDYDEYRTRKR